MLGDGIDRRWVVWIISMLIGSDLHDNCWKIGLIQVVLYGLAEANVWMVVLWSDGGGILLGTLCLDQGCWYMF